jgi:hypothetical protein
MSGAGSRRHVVPEGGDEGDGVAFRREHARIQSHHRRRLDVGGGDACVHRQELSRSGGEEEGAADAVRARDGRSRGWLLIWPAQRGHVFSGAFGLLHLAAAL